MAISQPLPSRNRGSYSRSPPRGNAEGPRIQYGASLGPSRGPCRVILCERSRASWLFITRLRCPPPSQAGPWKPKNVTVLNFALLLYLKYNTNPKRLYSKI